MTRRTDGSILKGETELIEQAARDACYRLPVERDDPLSAARGIVHGLLIMLLIAGIIGLVVTLARTDGQFFGDWRF